MSKVAVVRVRGGISAPTTVRDTLSFLHIDRKNYCAVFDPTPSLLGMLAKVKDYVTWGEVAEDTLKAIEPRKIAPKKDKQAITAYRLQPPKKGYGAKGVKISFVKGGALGNRKDKINDLLMRMA